MKKIIFFSWLFFQLLAIVYLWVILIITVFTQKSISEMINWEWWLLFIAVDLWSTKFFHGWNSPKKDDGSLPDLDPYDSHR